MRPIQRRLQQKVLTREAYRPASDFHSNKVLQNTATRYAARTPHAKTVTPASKNNITAKYPLGAPMVDINVGKGLPVEPYATITVDTTTVNGGTGLTLTPIKLFDVHAWYDSKVAVVTNPAGSVYIGSVATNSYDPFVRGVCSKNMHFESILMQVEPTAAATATPKQQFQQLIQTWNFNQNTVIGKDMPIPNYIDGYQQDPNVRVIPLDTERGRVGNETAWVGNFYPGLIVTFTLFVLAETRD